ncbi:hypothetical protein ABEB36_008844 [Hypothenemus hampei]|uniref:Protein sleepless n=1 Tax=Hypothenemus hampei TaxID=57062 RepID=A0ABD1EQE1_HYPHA
MLTGYFSTCLSTLLITFISQSNAQSNFRSIMCYDCWPTQTGVNCTEIGTQNLLVNCTNWGVADVIVSCFSAYLSFDNVPGILQEETGVYRGCGQRDESIIDFCQYYKETVLGVNIELVSCAECHENGCNNHRFNESGYIVTDGQDFIRISIPALLIGLIGCRVILLMFLEI